MAETLFKLNIEKLKFNFISDNTESGVLFTANYLQLKKSINPEIIFALETAKEKFEADAVYFRYFNDGRGAVPQIYLYDNTNNCLDDKQKDIHIKVWSGCQVPMYIIIDKSSVSLFDAREKAKEDKESKAYETIKLTGVALKNFSAQSFDDGLFWEQQENTNRFLFEKSAWRDLIYGLKKVYKDFQEKSGLDSHVALKLLVQSLLIKYLEEREELGKTGYFAETYFQNYFGCSDFCEIIRAGKLLELLDQLSTDFNGKIFEWHPSKEVKDRESIAQCEIQLLADYLDGKIINDQYVIWRLYSFSNLPVELISSVYEALLTTSKDIVYTPEMVVSTLVDECMPLKNPKDNFKLIDVSCGSGIFLVKSYKRIIQWWRYKRWQETGQLEKPSLNTLKELLLSSVYGIDIQEDAIRLSVFSLALALLDEVDLKPPVWQELKFPDLGEKNIIAIDFFRFITSNPICDFDMVIGNPPFNLQPINGKEPNRKNYFSELTKTFGYKSDLKIPDENPALHFLTQAMKLLKNDALLCLIQPSGPLLYQKDNNFKNAFFSKYNLFQVIDFTKLADVLWGKRNVATCAVFIQNSEPDGNDVAHVIANRTFSNLSRLFLEFDHYDFYCFDKGNLANPHIWKSNLIGGGRIFSLIDRLSKIKPVLIDFLEDKVKNDKWKYCEGYTVGNKKHFADYIHNKLSVKPENLTENGVEKFDIEKENYFEAPRKDAKEIYLAPHILIKENIGEKNLPIVFLEKDAVFSHEIIGIHAPKNDIKLLESLFCYLKDNSNLLRFYLLATSSRVLIGRASALLKIDIDHLPYPRDLKELSISKSDSLIIEDVLKYYSKTKEKNLYNLINKDQTSIFSDVFCQALNSIYKIENKSFRLFKTLDSGKYFAVHFEYTDKDFTSQHELVNDLEEYIEQIIPSKKEIGKSYHIQRVLKVYGKDCIILAKPKQLRYWLPSIALRDADDAFADYIKARYY